MMSSLEIELDTTFDVFDSSSFIAPTHLRYRGSPSLNSTITRHPSQLDDTFTKEIGDTQLVQAAVEAEAVSTGPDKSMKCDANASLSPHRQTGDLGPVQMDGESGSHQHPFSGREKNSDDDRRQTTTESRESDTMMTNAAAKTDSDDAAGQTYPNQMKVANKLNSNVTKRKEKKKAAKLPKVCLASCRRKSGDMTRCCLCMCWYHNACIDNEFEASETAAVWICTTCRMLPCIMADMQNRMKQMEEAMNSQVECMEKMKDNIDEYNEHLKSCEKMQNKNHAELIQRLDEMTKKIGKNSTVNETQWSQLQKQSTDYNTKTVNLAMKVGELSQELRAANWENSRLREKVNTENVTTCEEKETQKEDLVLRNIGIYGDSMVQDIQSNDEVTINYYPGARIKSLHDEIRKEKFKYNKIFIMVGTNNCSDAQATEDSIREYENLLEAAKSLSTVINVSSLCPRKDQYDHQERVVELNKQLKALCEKKENVTFIDNDDTFYLRNDDINGCLIQPKGLHLTRAGTERLICNYGLTQLTCYSGRQRNRISDTRKQKKRDTNPVVHIKDSPKDAVKFKGASSPLSNFFGDSVRIWGRTFPHIESAYQYKKCIDHQKWGLAEDIAKTSNPVEAMRKGKTVRTGSNWMTKKIDIMYSLLQEKLKQSSVFKEELMSTGSAEIIEDTQNEFWGRGKTWKGLNMLGCLLMELRKEISQMPYDEPESVICLDDDGGYSDVYAGSPARDNQRQPYRQQLHEPPTRERWKSVTTYSPEYRNSSVKPKPPTMTRDGFYRPQQNRQYYQGHDYPSRIQDQKVCWRCGERGHLQDKCFFDNEIKCWDCGELGHKAKHHKT